MEERVQRLEDETKQWKLFQKAELKNASRIFDGPFAGMEFWVVSHNDRVEDLVISVYLHKEREIVEETDINLTPMHCIEDINQHIKTSFSLLPSSVFRIKVQCAGLCSLVVINAHPSRWKIDKSERRNNFAND